MYSKDRLGVLRAIARVRAGDTRAISASTRLQKYLCATLLREVVNKGVTGNPWGAWRVLQVASNFAGRRRHNVRFAVDYESAMIELGLSHKGPPIPGDVLFQPWQREGHVGLYFEDERGAGFVLENTAADRGEKPYGFGPVRVTRIEDWGEIRTIASPTVASLADLRPSLPPVIVPKPVPVPVPASAGVLFDTIPNPPNGWVVVTVLNARAKTGTGVIGVGALNPNSKQVFVNLKERDT